MEKIGQREGAGLSGGHSSGSQSSDKALFLAVRAELDAVKAGGLAVEANATDLASAILLVNELKGLWNGLVATAKQFEA